METTTLTIPAMQNDAGATAVTKALEAVAGVDSIQLTPAHARARIRFDELQASRGDLRAAVEQAGFVVDDAPRQGCCGGCGG